MNLKKQIIVAYLSSILFYISLDALWIGFLGRDFYNENIGHLFAATVNWPVVIVFYFIFAAGLSLFAVAPALKLKSLRYAFAYGALFGFFTFMTYDLTNWATLTGWTSIVSYVDIVWGTFVSGLVATLSYVVAQKIGK